jgi:hypothetical protein
MLTSRSHRAEGGISTSRKTFVGERAVGGDVDVGDLLSEAADDQLVVDRADAADAPGGVGGLEPFG